MDIFAGASPRHLARAAGALYLVNIVLGVFALGVVPVMLVVSGDPAATAHNIQDHELLYRLGLLANVVECATNIPLAVIFYELFKVVDRRLALLVAFFTLVGTALQAAGVLNQFTTLFLLGGGPYTSALPNARVQALAFLSADLSPINYSIYTVFFALYLICLAYLVLRSAFLPGVIGLLLAIESLANLVHSVANFLAPGFASHLVPWILLPGLAEVVLCAWLLVVGLDVERWKEWASAAVRIQSTPVEALT